ncbi:hypothetical protein KAU11_07470 [Candidatus Babeliales bacterium]|nr:hypothetical protein [Candidatus Babeliales bacterium]
MFQTKLVEEGHKAYYDDVPRYKNPYDGENTTGLWLEGWDRAEQEHRLFTENQELKSHISTLSLANTDEIIALKTERAEALEEAMFLVQDIHDMRERFCKDVNSLLEYVRGLGTFSFPREKIIDRIHQISLPEVEKKNPK